MHVTGWTGKNVAEGRNTYEIIPAHTESIYTGHQDKLLAYKVSQKLEVILYMKPEMWAINAEILCKF